jgi:transposase
MPMVDPTVSSDGPSRADRVEVITSVQRRRRWTTAEKVRIVAETHLPDQSVSLVARRYGISANQLFTWRRLMARGAFTAAGAGEEVVPASELRAAQQQIRELQRLLGKKTLETEILREAMERVVAPKKLPLRVTSWPGDGR